MRPSYEESPRIRLPDNPRDLKRVVGDARRLAMVAEPVLVHDSLCPLVARFEHPGMVVDGGPVFVVAPGELVDLSRVLSPYGVPEVEPVQKPALFHPEGRGIELRAKLRRVDGRALVSGPRPQVVVARVAVEVVRAAAEELARLAAERIADLADQEVGGADELPSAPVSTGALRCRGPLPPYLQRVAADLARIESLAPERSTDLSSAWEWIRENGAADGQELAKRETWLRYAREVRRQQ